MTQVSVVLCGVLASCKHIQLAILLQFGSALLHNRFSVLIGSGTCNFACCKWNKQSDSSFFSISVHCIIYSMNTITTAYNLEFQPYKSVAMFRSCDTGLMIVCIVISLGCTSDISVFEYLCHLTSLDPHWIGWRDRLLNAYRQAHLHIYFTWRTCIPALWGHVASPLCPYAVYSDQHIMSAWLISVPTQMCFLLVTGSVMVHVHENQPVHKLPVPALLIATLIEYNWHEVNDFLFFAGFVNCQYRWEWTSSGCSMHSTIFPI